MKTQMMLNSGLFSAERKSLFPGTETRTRLDCEIRAVREGEKRFVEWSPFVLGVRSSGMGRFVEILDENSITAETKMDDIVGLVNHEATIVLGRASNSTLSFRREGNRYIFRAELRPTFDEDLFSSFERGDIKGGSFGFRAMWEDYNVEESTDDIYVVRLMKISEIYEVSIVTFPAYDVTNDSVVAATRSIEEYEKKGNVIPPITPDPDPINKKEESSLKLALGLV